MPKRITIELSESQRRIILGALTEKLVDVERYLRSSQVDANPGPLDTCCDAHRQRHQVRLETYRALKAQRRNVRKTLSLLDDAATKNTLEEVS